jgi:hypothetical protein
MGGRPTPRRQDEFRHHEGIYALTAPFPVPAANGGSIGLNNLVLLCRHLAREAPVADGGNAQLRCTKPGARARSLGFIEYVRLARTRSVNSKDTLGDTFEREPPSLPCSTHALRVGHMHHGTSEGLLAAPKGVPRAASSGEFNKRAPTAAPKGIV